MVILSLANVEWIELDWVNNELMSWNERNELGKFCATFVLRGRILICAAILSVQIVYSKMRL